MKIIKVGIIGLGNIAYKYDTIKSVKRRIAYPTHISALKKVGGYRLVGVADTSPTARRDFTRTHGTGIPVFKSHRDLLKELHIDLLVVATPAASHASVCIDAASAGVKAILCEKPIAQSVQEARELMAIMKSKRIFMSVNYFRNFDAKYERLMNAVNKGIWGQPLSAAVVYSHGIYNYGTHMIALLIHYFGKAKHLQALPGTNTHQRSRDPSISFFAVFGTLPVVFTGLPKAIYRTVEMDIMMSKGRIRVAGDKLTEYNLKTQGSFTTLNQRTDSVYAIDIGSSMLDVYRNIRSEIGVARYLHSSAYCALDAIEVASSVIKSAENLRY